MIRKDNKENLVFLTYKGLDETIKILKHKNIKISQILTPKRLFEEGFDLEHVENITNARYEIVDRVAAIRVYANRDDVIKLHKKVLKTYKDRNVVKILSDDEGRKYVSNQ